MNAFLLIAGLVILAPLAVMTLPFIVEVAAGLLPPRRPRASTDRVTNAILLIPAHEEGANIETVLARVLARLSPAVRVLVVADNCTDDTAAAARRAGADVIERHDPDRRGKGYALAFGRDHLRASPPDAVVVIDADCTPEPRTVETLAARAVALNAAVQGVNLLAPRLQAPAMVQISSFAFLVKNLIRQRGLARIGAAAMLGGTGMAVPWRLFKEAPLATGNIVEDLAFGLDLIQAGEPPRFVPDAAVWTDPADAAATIGQRTRWENGFLTVARTRALPLIVKGIRRRKFTILWAGLHLATPPLALLMALNLLGLATLGLLAVVGMPVELLFGAMIMVGAVVVLVLAAWALHGRRWLSPTTLVRLPLYLAWKLPIYLRLARGRGETRWVRTDRSRWD